MPGSFLARHRTICAVLEEMRELNNSSEYPVFGLDALIDEAKGYAQSMSAKLLEYKLAKEQADAQDQHD